MPEITRATQSYRRSKEQHRRVKRIVLRSLIFVVVVVLAITSFGYYRYANALPLLSAQITASSYAPPAPQPLAWPGYGQAAVGTEAFGLLETHGEQKQSPTASTAKLITALAVLEAKPLRKDDQGPIITMGPDDVARVASYLAKDGSVVAVSTGQQLTQYQMLQAMLLPSANNIADSLAVWAYGSLENYTSQAQQYLESIGIKNTTVGVDASGMSPTTKSTAGDLVKIGQHVMKNQILAQIVNQKQANIPGVGIVRSTNILLGQDAIIGLKTGNTIEAGGVFLLAASHQLVSGQKATVIAAIMGAPNVRTAMFDSRGLYLSAAKNLVFVNVVKSGDIVGTYTTPWGKKYAAVAASTINGPIWLSDSAQQPKFTFNSIKPPQDVGTTVGQIAFKRADGIELKSEIRLAEKVDTPSWQWRIFGKE